MMLLAASLRITLVAAAAAIALAAGRVRSDRARHAIWTLVLVAMLTMPVLPSVVPSIDLPVLGPAAALPDGATAPDASIASQPPSAVVPATAPEPALAVTPGRQPVDAGQQGKPSRWTVTSVVRGIYLAGLGAAVVHLLAGWLFMLRLSRRARPVTVPGAAGPVYESDLISTPVTLGVVAPKVVLPVEWRGWSDETLRGCLAHEMAHVRGRDPLIGFVARINRCVFWFHPLAWWLERTLRTTAEHAADSAAVRQLGARPYAAVLLGIAEDVRLRGGRVSWQGIGVGGSGSLERRIARVLGGSATDAPPVRQALVFATCVAAIVLVAACRRPASPPPLQPDPEVAARLQEQKAGEEFFEAARNMTAEQVDSLEAQLKRTPGDRDALKKLRIFYGPASGQKVFDWNTMIERRRPHMLWLIDHLPEDDLAMWRVSAEADPVGYGESKRRWLAQANKPDTTAAILYNAAEFFREAEPRLAEQMLLRGKALDPDGRTVATASKMPLNWSRSLGWLYASVLAGRRDPKNGKPLTPLDADPYAKDVRQRLEASTDVATLGAAGEMLARIFGDVDRARLGRQLLERALQLDPQQARFRALLASLERTDRSTALNGELRAKAAQLGGNEEQAVAQFPESSRLTMLLELATRDYSRAEYLESSKKDADGAATAWARSKRYADAALAMAGRSPDHPDRGKAIYWANVTLAVHALREGHREAAVRLMRDATMVPVSLAWDGSSFGLELKLVNELLKAGERESVAEFLERSAALQPAQRERLLKDAADIRAGRMPMSYQYMVARSG